MGELIDFLLHKKDSDPKLSNSKEIIKFGRPIVETVLPGETKKTRLDVLWDGEKHKANLFTSLDGVSLDYDGTNLSHCTLVRSSRDDRELLQISIGTNGEFEGLGFARGLFGLGNALAYHEAKYIREQYPGKRIFLYLEDTAYSQRQRRENAEDYYSRSGWSSNMAGKYGFTDDPGMVKTALGHNYSTRIFFVKEIT